MALSERELLLELARREKTLESVYRELSKHPKQFALVTEKSLRSAAQCGRRSGKSTGIAGKYMVTAVSNPGGLSVFIAISAARANDIIGAAFRKLGMSTGYVFRETKRDGQIYWIAPNGHAVWVAGCKNRADAEKFRGSFYCGAAVDECDSMRSHLEYLVEEVLEPALLDKNGWLALTGTPGCTMAGYFYEITTGEGSRHPWPTHHWNVLDNPFLPHAGQWLEEKRTKSGLDPTSPSYIREWLGQWCRDIDSLCYPYDHDRNGVWGPLDTVSTERRYVLGVDLGVVDSTAFALGAYDKSCPELHLLEAWSKSGLSPSGAAVKVLEYRHRFPGIRVVADTGGIGRAFTEEWAQRHGIQAEAAVKTDVRGQIWTMAGMLRSGVIKVHLPGCSSLVAEWQQLPWDEDRSGHDPAYPDHESDAARICALAMSPNYKAEQELPEPGTPEFVDMEEAKRKAEVFARARKKSKGRR